MPLQKGTVLKNKWTIDAPLGSGGMATVYSAMHRIGSRVAIKMLHPEISKVDDVCSRFLREGYVANAVEHPGVVRVYDDDVAEDGAVFLVMELLEGEPLDAFWKRNGRKLPEHQVLTIADQILDVLVAAHDKSIIHRDVKPQNIFLMQSGGLKILDFGIARLKESAAGSRGTITGAFMGTPAYVPPEQARARWELVDGRSDLWAVGATMYVLLTGKLVHVAGTMNEQLLAAMTQPAPRVATLRPDLPEAQALTMVNASAALIAPASSIAPRISEFVPISDPSAAIPPPAVQSAQPAQPAQPAHVSVPKANSVDDPLED